MDNLYKHGLTKLFLIIALEVVRKFGIKTKYSHLDSSSLHLHGEYKNCLNNEDKEQGNMEREKQCWEETNLKHLRERGVDTGLTDYIQEVEERLVEIIKSD